MAILPDVIRLGPVVLPNAWIAWLISFLFASALLKRSLQKQGFDGDKQTGWLLEAVLFGYVLYRLVTIGADGAGAWTSFRTLLLSVGPGYALGLGTVGGIVYLIGRAGRDGVVTWRWLEAWVLPVTLTAVLHALLVAEIGRATNMPWGVSFDGASYHPVHLYRAAAWALAAWWLYRLRTSPRQRVAAAVTFWAGAQLIASWFLVQQDLWFGIAPSQWLALIAISAGGYAWTADEHTTPVEKM